MPGQWIEVAGGRIFERGLEDDGKAPRGLIEVDMGICVQSPWNIRKSLVQDRLAEILPDFPLVTSSAIWALYPSTRIVIPKVRAMIAFLLNLNLNSAILSGDLY